MDLLAWRDSGGGDDVITDADVGKAGTVTYGMGPLKGVATSLLRYFSTISLPNGNKGDELLIQATITEKQCRVVRRGLMYSRTNDCNAEGAGVENRRIS